MMQRHASCLNKVPDLQLPQPKDPDEATPTGPVTGAVPELQHHLALAMLHLAHTDPHETVGHCQQHMVTTPFGC